MLHQSHGRGKNRSSSHEHRLSSGSPGGSKKRENEYSPTASKAAILKKALSS